jgi:predicted transcriptional regulator
LKDLREELGLTQEQFSTRSGIPYIRLTKMEQGVRAIKFTPSEIVGILRILRDTQKDPEQWFAAWVDAKSA